MLIAVGVDRCVARSLLYRHARLFLVFANKEHEMFARSMNRMTVVALAVVASGLLVAEVSAADREIVSFRLPQWTSAHFDEANSAQANFETFKRIGCEAEQHQHGGHFDVRYRCVNWRSIALTSHDEAHQWEGWLKKLGFETAHQH